MSTEVAATAAHAFVGLEISRRRLQAIADEAATVLVRSAFSVGIREMKDFSCAILTPDGTTVVQSSQSIPVFLGTITQTVRHLLAAHPLETLRPGDVVATNDPWLGTGHLFDLSAITPIYRDGEIVAVASVVAHLPDIGGRGFALDSKSVFEEGLRLMPCRLVGGGALDPQILSMIRANVRMPDQVVGDVEAILNAMAALERGLSRFLDDTSVEEFHDVCRELDERSAALVGRAIAGLPDGSWSAELTSEGVGGVPFTIRAALAVAGDRLTLDFAGSSSQVPAAINSNYSTTFGYAVFAVKCALAPEVPFNDGLLRALEVAAPPGSIVNSSFPAAGAVRTLVSHLVATLVLDLVGNVAPSARMAQSGAPLPSGRINGASEDGAFTAPLLTSAGFGARPDSDGPSAISFPTNTQCVPVEMIEATTPVLFVERELLADSGGAGTHRGGLGLRATARLLGPDAQLIVFAQRLAAGPEGRDGGLPGSPTRVYVDGQPVDELSAPIALKHGAAVTIESSGGGGLGDPRTRDREAVARDVRGGYISARAARELYGFDERGEDG